MLDWSDDGDTDTEPIHFQYGINEKVSTTSSESEVSQTLAPMELMETPEKDGGEHFIVSDIEPLEAMEKAEESYVKEGSEDALDSPLSPLSPLSAIGVQITVLFMAHRLID